MSNQRFVEDALNRIRKWFATNTPEADDNLAWGPPATEDSLNTLEKAIQTPLPDGFREAYRLYDGHGYCRIIEYGEFMPVNKILGAIKMKKSILKDLKGEGIDFKKSVKCDPEIRREFWNVKWLPFTDSGAGDYLCVDFVPATDGKPGQIIKVSHETGPEKVVAPSFLEMLTSQAERLDSGAYVYDTLNCQIKPK